MRALPDGWQRILVRELRAFLEPDPDVQALVLFGSSAAPETTDRLSDVDVMLVVRDGARARFFPSTAWLASIGLVFAAEQSVRAQHGVHRVCFDDMRRLDVIVVEEQVLVHIEEWSLHPLRGARSVVFSRSVAVDAAVENTFERVPANLPDAAMMAARLDDFWFVAQLALHKAARGDLLVGQHLHLKLLAHCLEMAMILRDRATDTRYHRRGEPTDAAALRNLAPAVALPGASPIAIVDGVEAACREFDRLMYTWDGAYAARLPLLQPLVDEIRGLIERAVAE